MMNGIIRRLRLLCLERSVALYVCHIPGAINLAPDALSRGALGKRVQDWSLVTQCMDKWVRAYELDFDAYADPSGSNAQSALFASSIDPPTPERVAGRLVWAFPPPSLAREVAGDWDRWDAAITAVVPGDVAESFGREWERVHVYALDSQICRRRVGGTWVRCKNVGVSLTVLHRARG